MTRPAERVAASVRRIDTPIGPLWAEATADALVRLSFRAIPQAAANGDCDSSLLETLNNELRAYFSGECVAFSVSLADVGTPFQRRVWDALAGIPYGQTWSYRQLAECLGQPDAVRAVGRANALNPWPILRPCHRVVGSDGSLTGFAGGLDVKRRLLDLEGALPAGLFVD